MLTILQTHGKTQRQNFPTKQIDKNFTRNRQIKPSNKTDKTFHGTQTKLSNQSQNQVHGWRLTVCLGSENIGVPLETSPLPKWGSHKTKPDYDSPRGLLRCLLLFSAWDFTQITHKPKASSEPWSIKRHMPVKEPLSPRVPEKKSKFRIWVDGLNLAGRNPENLNVNNKMTTTI